MERIAFVLVAATLLAACETVEGFGRDMENAGEAVEREAVEAQ